jgi:hypothetical protein
MGESLRSANRNTHVRIVAVALVSAIGVVIVRRYALALMGRGGLVGWTPRRFLKLAPPTASCLS